jgi:hypothetical protein
LALNEIENHDTNTSNGDKDNSINDQQYADDEKAKSENGHYIPNVDE